MKIVGYIILGSYALFNVITLVFLLDKYEFGPEVAGPQSIMASRGFFIAYHVWGIILAGICAYTMWKEVRMLFMISLLLLLIVMFYPFFTSSPVEKAKGKAGQEQVDSLRQ